VREFLLVRKGASARFAALSAEEKQRLLERYVGFVARLKREGRFRGGAGLAPGGFELRGERGIVLTDGPHAETKEALSGYLVFEAASYEEALAIARDCPALSHGEGVELFALAAA
jgi:hypothetical protein